jgi:adenine-specific DNA-methyltransferase
MMTTKKLYTKAFQELVLYYLRERITHKNLELRHLVATNINEWFIFDEHLFERLFAQNKGFVKQFENFESSKKTTEVFYKEIAEPFIDNITSEVEFTYFNIQDFQKPLRNTNKEDDNSLIALFKLLSPEHLLKLPFTNDSNSLDKRFYSEMLHIIGLIETKEGSKKLIGRNKSGERYTGTILEDAIIQLDSLEKLSRLENPEQYGSSQQERLFNVALELSITWINRILFLKLLEAQLITYHKGDKSYSFLNLDKIKSYDDLNSLFFQVLARKHDERSEDVKTVFEKVPYLNSSLFEPTEIEQLTLFISNLNDDKAIPAYSQTVLKDQQGKKRTGNISTLEYLFEFLDAYDFGAEGSEEIQEENKTLINASVLGLIFEKINGYKDGSFFTPGFITMYMCRETIRRAVVQKFKQEFQSFEIENIDNIYDLIPQKISKKKANELINSIKICDPAVGSGHFLVSALNEMIALKNDLKILQDRDGKSLHRYEVEVHNDELVVTDEEGELYEYNPNNKESQRIQVTLFHEKQTIIENCLFGVDINPNSVKICRLRLWIELLKNAYYKNAAELETLPNIDINIKCGNSLVSRFALDADLQQALKKSKWTIDSYRIAVATYRNAENREQKREMERLIAGIKTDFRIEIAQSDPKLKKLRKLSGDLYQLTNQQQLFEMSKKEQVELNRKVLQLTEETKNLENEIEEIKSNKIFENAFEWRFEFPEVLNDDGDFIGFDVVIGNPPYIRQEEFSEIKPYLLSNYLETGTGTADLFIYFVELSFRLMKSSAEFAFITPNKWMRAGYGNKLRKFIAKQKIHYLIDFGDLPVFEEATTYPIIIQLNKSNAAVDFLACNISTLSFKSELESYISDNKIRIQLNKLSPEAWTLSESRIQALLSKIRAIGLPLGEYANGKIYRGILTGLNEAFIVDKVTRDRLISEDRNSAEILKPFMAGRNIKRYQSPIADKFLVFFPKGFTIKRNLSDSMVSEPPPRYGDMPYDDAWEWIKKTYPAIANHLLPFKDRAMKRTDKGDYWWELRACDYYDEFEKEKIVYPNICKQPEFTFDDGKSFTNQKCFIITKFNLTFLGILNSKLFFFLFRSILPKLRGDFYEPSYAYFKTFPVIDKEDIDISRLVLNCLKLKKQNDAADTTDLENQINQLVYQLYGLTEEEIKIIERT